MATKISSTSGWCLNGPGREDESGKGYALMAIYPAPKVPGTEQFRTGTLDFRKDTLSPTDTDHMTREGSIKNIEKYLSDHEDLVIKS